MQVEQLKRRQAKYTRHVQRFIIQRDRLGGTRKPVSQTEVLLRIQSTLEDIRDELRRENDLRLAVVCSQSARSSHCCSF